MATRNDIQVALDIVRFVNLAHDLVDTASYSMKEVDTLTGLDLLYTEQSGAKREFTFGELIDRVRGELQAALAYEAMINDFISNYSQQGLTTALDIWGMSIAALQSDLTAIGDEARYILTQLNSAKQKQDLIPLSAHIDQAVPKLALVRKAWTLEK